MARFFLKQVVWNTNDYHSPSGEKASKESYPGEHGFAHEEWNNSPAMEAELENRCIHAFNIQGLGKSGAEESAGANFIFMYASHDRQQQLVGVAGNAVCLSDPERASLAKRLKVQKFWRDAWAVERVRDCYDNDRDKFMRRWNKEFHWLPRWVCPADLFFWPREPVVLNPPDITGKPKLLSMFASYTTINPDIAQRVMGAVPKKLRTSAWSHIVEAINAPSNEVAVDIENILGDEDVGETTRRSLVDSRIGQGRFRSKLDERWGGACAATGCSLGQVLRASHIKPWSESTNKERLNPRNGLLLAANLDALFDRGLISFRDDGSMVLSSQISQKERKRLGLPVPLRRPPDNDERRFLSFHRNYWGL